MNGFMRLGLIVWLLMGMSGVLTAQTYTFEIRYGSHVIGNIEAYCKLNGAVKNILIKSRSQMMLMSKLNSDLKCEYANDVLTEASVVRHNNKSGGERSTITRRQGRNYVISLNGESTHLNNTDILHSVANLYFTEPRQLTRIYSEAAGRFLPLKALGNGAYELTLPEGRKIIYKYQKGLLTEVEVNHALGKAYFVKTG